MTLSALFLFDFFCIFAQSNCALVGVLTYLFIPRVLRGWLTLGQITITLVSPLRS